MERLCRFDTHGADRPHARTQQGHAGGGGRCASHACAGTRGEGRSVALADGQLAADTEHNDYSGAAAKDDAEFDVKVSLAWELDLWGNLRWANRRAVAEYLASVEAQRALQMTLVAEVATAYYELVALDQELSIVRPYAPDPQGGGCGRRGCGSKAA